MAQTWLAFCLAFGLYNANQAFKVKEYRATTSFQYIRKAPTSDNGHYVWNIRPVFWSTTYFLEVYWLTFNVQGSMPKCSQDSVEVFITRKYASIGKFCSSNTRGYKMNYMFSIDGAMRIKYISRKNADLYLRFRLRSRQSSYMGSYLTTACYNTNNYLGSGIIYSAGYPRSYRRSSRSCFYRISTSAGMETRIVFMDLHLLCRSYDYVAVRGSDSPTSTYTTSQAISGALCNYQPIVLLTRKRYIHIRFRRALGSTLHRGFVLSYLTYAIQPPSLLSGICNFEVDKCGYVEDEADHFNWRRNRGKTASWTTGPEIDHSTETVVGYYLYIESSIPRKLGDVSRISKRYTGLQAEGSCLSFWYHMFGTQIGRLNVYLKNSATSLRGSPSWSAVGQQGNEWLQAHLKISRNSTVVVFEGVIGLGFRGDIAIDDVFVRSGPCINSGERDFFLIRHHYGGLCVSRNHDDYLVLTSSCNEFFAFNDDGSLLHVDSLKCAVALGKVDNSFLKLQSRCASADGIAQTSGSSLKHLETDKCIHPLNGSHWPANGTKIVIYAGCNELRLRFDLVNAIPTTQPITTSPVTTVAATTRPTSTTAAVNTRLTSKTTAVNTRSTSTTTAVNTRSTSTTTAVNARSASTTTAATTRPTSTTAAVSTRPTSTTAAVSTRLTSTTTAVNARTISTSASSTSSKGDGGIPSTQPSSRTTGGPNLFGQASPSVSKPDHSQAIIIALSCFACLLLVMVTICVVMKLRKKRSVEEPNVLNGVSSPRDKAENVYVRHGPLNRRPLPAGPSTEIIARPEVGKENPSFDHCPVHLGAFNAESRQAKTLPICNASRGGIELTVSAGNYVRAALEAELKPSELVPSEERQPEKDHEAIYDVIEESVFREILEQSTAPPEAASNQGSQFNFQGLPCFQPLRNSLFSDAALERKVMMSAGRRMSENVLPPVINSFKKPSEQQRRASLPVELTFANHPLASIKSSKLQHSLNSPSSSPLIKHGNIILEEEGEKYLAPSELKAPGEPRRKIISERICHRPASHSKQTLQSSQLRAKVDVKNSQPNSPPFEQKKFIRQDRRCSESAAPPMIESFKKPNVGTRRNSTPVIPGHSDFMQFPSTGVDHFNGMGVLEEEDTNYLAACDLKAPSKTVSEVCLLSKDAEFDEQKISDSREVESTESGYLQEPNPPSGNSVANIAADISPCKAGEFGQVTLQENEKPVVDADQAEGLYISMLATNLHNNDQHIA